MFRKALTLLAIVGILAAVQPQSASAQLMLQLTTPGAVAQNNQFACLGPVQYAAAIAQNPALALALFLQRLGISPNQVVGTPCLALVDGRYVYEIWVNVGGVTNRRVIDAITGR